MTNRILHVAFLDKFIPGFVDIVSQHFSKENHTIITYGDVSKYFYPQSSKAFNFPKLKGIRSILVLIFALHRHNKIILHGLFSPQLILLLSFMPWLHKKCMWTIWGGDLYSHKLAPKNIRFYFIEFFKKIIIPRFHGLITYVDGDYQYAKEWYNAKGLLYECIMYRSNVYSGKKITEKDFPNPSSYKITSLHIQVGNSADPSNKHQEIFDRIFALNDDDRIDKIFCPLAYGNMEYAEHIKKVGEVMFGDKFHALMDFIPLEKYNEILEQVDIAIFSHNRQQAMGNIINLLGRGKTVYLRADTSSYNLFKKLGVEVYPLEELTLIPQDFVVSTLNNSKIRSYFSEKKLVEQLKSIFNE
ncbi:TDP-N-acetylfucosamine:lipid II N-acetylfucosaminyltransferase [Shewanella algae]|uniref:TDP-N-acetylfucosamine:lipid II N-acetylfucosaminyltransferase n=1 Tax=Shewanella algae TaxID=38313 RepID=UPI001AAC540D|nr:TDP-N-acetylfucosamine:lipid II N-acetylfucosaminyltransferase [Shewanella algae]MBO2670258.1 TDP-N-acetylfucosamine:lipid II N-acetylfucosaminyltransferase [Shewanella algae]